MQFLKTRIIEHRAIAKDTWQVTVTAPELAECGKPGQFVMVRLADCNDPLIGRALALYDVGKNDLGVPNTVSLVYVVKGKFTQALSRQQVGQSIELWGPLGNAFSQDSIEHLILVAGGVGITPMLMLANAALGKDNPRQPGFAHRVTLCYGARSKEYLAGLDRFKASGVKLDIATEDGSLGIRGRVTDSLERILSDSTERCRIACCGPEPMMQAVGKLASRFSVPCEVSLETPMACGIGICFTCVAKVQQSDGSWDYRRTCVEGPIFQAEQIVW